MYIKTMACKFHHNCVYITNINYLHGMDAIFIVIRS